MSVINVRTYQGIKKVRIEGDEPTPEEIERIKFQFQPDRTFDDQMSGMTAPMQYSAPPAPRQIPEIKSDPLSPAEQQVAKQRGIDYFESEDAMKRGDAVSSNVPDFMKSRFVSKGPTQGETVTGKGYGRALSGLTALGVSPFDQELAKQIDVNLANIPSEPGLRGITEGLLQFQAFFSPAKALLRGPIKNRYLRDVSSSAISGGVAFSGQEQRLADILQSIPQLRNPVFEALETDPDDSFYEARMKSMLEMAGLDAAFAAPFVKGIKKIKKSPMADINLSNKLKDFVKENPYKATGSLALGYGVYSALPDDLAEDFAKTGSVGLGMLAMATAPIPPGSKGQLRKFASVIAKNFGKADDAQSFAVYKKVGDQDVQFNVTNKNNVLRRQDDDSIYNPESGDFLARPGDAEWTSAENLFPEVQLQKDISEGWTKRIDNELGIGKMRTKVDPDTGEVGQVLVESIEDLDDALVDKIFKSQIDWTDDPAGMDEYLLNVILDNTSITRGDYYDLVAKQHQINNIKFGVDIDEGSWTNLWDKNEYLKLVDAGVKQEDFARKLSPVEIFESVGIKGRAKDQIKSAGISEQRIKEIEDLADQANITRSKLLTPGVVVPATLGVAGVSVADSENADAVTAGVVGALLAKFGKSKIKVKPSGVTKQASVTKTDVPNVPTPLMAKKKTAKGQADTTTLNTLTKDELFGIMSNEDPYSERYVQAIAVLARRASANSPEGRRLAKELEDLYYNGKSPQSTKVQMQPGTVPDYLTTQRGRDNILQDIKIEEGIQKRTNQQLVDLTLSGSEIALKELQRRAAKNPNSKAVKLMKKNGIIPPEHFRAHAGQLNLVPLEDATLKFVGKTFNLASRGVNNVMQKSLVLSDTAIRPIKARIEEVSKRMAHKLDEFEVNQNTLAGTYMHRAAPFLDSFGKMSKNDKKVFTRHALNSEIAEAFGVLDKYKTKLPGIKREFEDLRNIFDELHELGNANGLEIDFRKDYLPRIMKDYEGFMKSKGVDPEGPIQKVLKQAREEKRLKLTEEAVKNNTEPPSDMTLSSFEEREVIRKFLEGNKYKGDGTPGFMKERVIDKIAEEDLQYYGSFNENVQNYINNLTYRVAKNQFTGKVQGVEGYAETLSKLLQRGKVTETQALKITDLINTRLQGGEKPLVSGLQTFRDLVYLTSIGNPISTLTQTTELMLNAYRYGLFDTVATVGKTIKGKGIKMSDLGIDDIARDFADPLALSQKGLAGKSAQATNYLLRKTLGAVQFKRLDQLMKESNLNTAFRVAQKKVANTKSKQYQKFAKEMSEYYGPETKKFLDALKRGDKNDPNVKVYLYSQLAKTQPIGLSEYSEFYLKNPAARPAYFLKSFTLKQLETTRRDVLRKLGSDKPEEVKDGMRQALRLSVMFGGAMTGNNILKDYLLDRDDKPGMLGDQMPTKENVKDAGADAILTLFGLSRYTTRRIAKEPLYGIIDMVLPPKLTDTFQLGESIVTGDLNEAGRVVQKNIPIGGKIYSEHWGSGAKYKRKKRIEKYRRSKRQLENFKIEIVPDLPEMPEF